jgi:ADP-ribose pyrophosphatase
VRSDAPAGGKITRAPFRSRIDQHEEPSMFKVEEVGHETKYRGFFRIDLRRFRHTRFDGSMSGVVTREMFERGNAVAVLLYDPKADRVVMTRQFLVGAHYAGLPAWPLQIVAGTIDQGDTEEATARREAEEEAGVRVTDLKKITTFLPSPGGSTEVITLFCALVDSTTAGGVWGLAEENEDIKVEVLPALEALERLDNGEITAATAVIALHWLARHRQELRA